MKHVDNSCEIRKIGNRSGKDAESIDNMSSPHIDYTRVLPFSDLQQLIAGMNGNKEARGTLSGAQCRNDITESEHLTDTHKKVYEDEDAKVGSCLSRGEIFNASQPAELAHRESMHGPCVSTTNKARSRERSSQSPCALSQRKVLTNEGSRESNPLLPNVVRRCAYERRLRYKTRPDRYQLKDTGGSAIPSSSKAKARKSLTAETNINNVVENLSKDRSNPSFPSTPAGVTERGIHRKKRRQGITLETSFKTHNVTQRRLSLPVNYGIGFLNRARGGNSGVPDLSFSGMEFLTNGFKRQKKPEEAECVQMKQVKEVDDSGTISRYFSKQPVEPPIPQRYSTERNGPQASRQPSNFLLNPGVGAHDPTGTELLALESGAELSMPNITANSFRQASVNPSESASNPFWNQANRATHWLPQIKSQTLDARRAMLMAARTARTIAMLDQCKKAVQHAAQMVSNEDKHRIDMEVERDYPIPKLVSKISFQDTKRAIEEMIRGENQFLAEICTAFDPEINDFRDTSEERREVNGSGSLNTTANPAPDSNHSGPSIIQATSNDFQNRPSLEETKSSLNDNRNAASSSNHNQHQSRANESVLSMSGSSTIPNNRNTVQSQPEDGGLLSQQKETPGSGKLSVPILDLIQEPTSKSMVNPVQYLLGKNTSNDIHLIGNSGGNRLKNIHPLNSDNSEIGKARPLEHKTGNIHPSFLWNAPNPEQPFKPGIEVSTDDILLDLIHEEGSAVGVSQSRSSTRAQCFRNCLVPPQRYPSQPFCFNGPIASKNPLETNSNNPTWWTELVNNPHLSTNNSSYVNGGNRPTTPALSMRSEFPNTQSLDNDWVAEGYLASFIEPQLQFSPSSIQHAHRHSSFLHATAGSQTPRSVPAIPRSRTVPPKNPWYNNQYIPWGPSNEIHISQQIPNPHPPFARQDLSPESNKFSRVPPTFLPFSHPNKLH
ncbi:hypothetical protein I7I50_01983 [Histoplasma capsulatum G186AR]|uniref:Uncharacterized protein n=1 Tax=Ajellomyces capsulatus TaxID=5037 RepID=A0A8H8CSV7_AJECA|nr:hypothetical protein I7I52_12197 [Histoplasma capsulatum]QSS71225.1 hypothetical protein I7I50_01983 [Histoplasma capsulatum G186AR]